MDQPTSEETTAAHGLIEKIRSFAASLDENERPLFAALLAPGVDAAWSADVDAVDGGDEVSGFTFEWRPDRLPDHLVRAIHGVDLRITYEPG